MNRYFIRRIMAPLALLVALSGCILVDDFAPKWQAGKTDSCTNKIAQSLYLSEFRRDPEGKDMKELARSFSINNMHFLMLKKSSADAGGRMYRFGVVNGIFQRYRLDPSMKRAFEISYPNAPVSLAHDTVTFTKLGADEMKLLGEISGKTEYWEIEDQTLYNVLRNPTCIYEDRDLAAEDAAAKKKAEKAKK